MPQLETAIEIKSEMERHRIEAVVETLSALRSNGNSLVELTHDARNMVTALSLYCDLLGEPGVLGTSFAHYAGELRLVVDASRHLVDKLGSLDVSLEPATPYQPKPDMGNNASRSKVFAAEYLVGDPIKNLKTELLSCRNLLNALAGPSILVSVYVDADVQAVKLTVEDLTRVLVNLVKNAAESIGTAGAIRIALRELKVLPGIAPSLLLTVEDSGPGIPEELSEKVFDPGFSTRWRNPAADATYVTGRAGHRGLGLSITRSIIEAAGGRIRAAAADLGGARIEIELPVLSQ